MKNTILPGLVLLLITGPPAMPATRLVPDEYATIQAAIDDCNGGDVVIIAPGTYTGPGNRDIDLRGKAITVRSTEPNDPNIVAATIIDCNGTQDEPHRGFKFHADEGPDSVLAGLTITNGWSGDGGAIWCHVNTSPTIRNCILTDNWSFCGGGISCICEGTSIMVTRPIIANCAISHNTALIRGGGVSARISRGGVSPVITNCIISDNSAENGGGIYCEGDITEISGCTIVNNFASSFGGGIDCYNGQASVSHSVLWDNKANDGPQMSLRRGSDTASLTVSYSDVQGGQVEVHVERYCELVWGMWNIESDPRFIDPASGDYHISADSPCVGVGDPTYVPRLYETDIDGQARVLGGCIDMGADESVLFAQIPVIEYSSRQIRFTSQQVAPNPPAQSLFIRNRGIGTLRWAVIEDCPWLKVDPNTGESVNDIDPVHLSVHISGLSAGLYECELTIAANGAANSPATVPVILYISDGDVHVPVDCQRIQEAIDSAIDADVVVVADGIYTGEGNVDIDFRGKSITIRSENGPKNCIIDCNGTYDEYHRGFYFHTGEGAESVLEGFTITNGYADTGGGICCDGSSPTIRNCTITNNIVYVPWSGGYGGGVYCGYSSAIVDNCIICENTARPEGRTVAIRGGHGGGVYCYMSSPTIRNCVISHNDCAGNRGTGGIHCAWSNATILDCTLVGNKHSGVYCSQGRDRIKNCLAVGNQYYGITCYEGGDAIIENCIARGHRDYGIKCERSNPTISHCIVTGNSSWELGGGIYARRSSPTILNCTITGNSARYTSGGIYCSDECTCIVRNCVLWNNRPLSNQIWVETYGPASSCTILYSSVQGGQASVHVEPKCTVDWGAGNIDSDPCFVSPGYWDANGTLEDRRDDFWVDGDYHLKSQAARWNPNIQAWVQDDVTSPCIDAGDMASPIGLEPFPNGGIVNMGAYGGTAQASKSYFGSPVCRTIVAGDINGDCKIDYLDFGIMAFHWLEDH